MSKAPIDSAQRWRSLAEINRAIVGSLDYEEVLTQVVERTAEFTEADHCLLVMSDGADGVYIAAAHGALDPPGDLSGVPLDESIDADIRRWLGYADNEALVAVPVVRSGTVKGILAVGRHRAQPPDTEQRQLLSALADSAGIALHHAERYGESQRGLQAHRILTEKIFAHASMAMCVVGPELELLEINQAAAALFGLPRGDLLGEKLDALSTDLAEKLLHPCKTALSGQPVDIPNLAWRPHAEDRSDQYLEVDLIPLPDEAGVYRGVLMLAKDVTKRERHTQELEQSIESKDRFFNELSHELRGPLAAVSNATALLTLENISGDQRNRAHAVIERNVRQQARLVDDLLDFSRLSRNKLQLEMMLVDMRWLSPSRSTSRRRAHRTSS